MRRTSILLLLLLAVTFAWSVQPAYAQSGADIDELQEEISHLGQEVDAAQALYVDGKHDQAAQRIQELFIFWEQSDVHQRVHSQDMELYERIEGNLLSLQSAMRNDATVSEVQEASDVVRSDIGAAQRIVSASVNQGAALTGFFESFILIVREGFEAILIVGALLAYLNRTDHEDRTQHVYRGLFAGIGASLLTAAALHSVLSIGIVGQEILEGITALLAVVVLFYVSHWLVGKVSHARWEQFLKGKLKTALTAGGGWTLASVAFLSVYREGFETVLFYGALTNFYSGQIGALVAGFVVGLVVLAIIYGAFHLFQVRIPLRPFFLITSLLLYYLAFSFAGKGVHALQEAGVIGTTAIRGMPTLSLMGIFPTVETLTVQTLLLLLFAAGLAYTFVVEPYLQHERSPV